MESTFAFFSNFLQEEYVIFGTKKETNSSGRLFWGGVGRGFTVASETRSYKTF